jgi:hypothetical protein
MIKILKTILVSILVFLLGFSCNNKREAKFTNPSSVLQSDPQRFTINPCRDTTLIGTEGTEIIFQKNSFTTDEDSINIILQEFYSIPQMLFHNLSTTADGEIIETKGMCYINATTLSGDTLSLKENASYAINMPTTQEDGYKLFYGEKKGDIINWEEGKEQGYGYIDMVYEDSVLIFSDTTIVLYNEFLNVTKLGWINSDAFIFYNETEELIVNLKHGYENTCIYLVFKNRNTIIPPNKNKQQFLFKKIPTREEVILVGFGLKGDNLYYVMQDMVIDGKEKEIDELTPIKKEELEKILQEKFGTKL